MAGTNGIDIIFFHNPHILEHPFGCHPVTPVRIDLMAVHTFDQDRRTVHPNLVIAQFDFPDAYLLRNYFEYPVSVFQSSGQRIQIRCLGRPFPGILDSERGIQFTIALQLFGSNHITFGIRQFQVHNSTSFQVESHLDCPVFIVCIQIGGNPDIFDIFRITGIEIAVAGYSGKAYEILVFQISPVTPAEHLESNQVLTRFQVFSQVELGFQLAVFTISDIFTVYPQIHIGRNGTEMSKNLFPLPAGRQFDLPAV